jgi:methyl-accepting chemotaxis protein
MITRHLKNLSLKTKLLFLPVLFLSGLAVLQATNLYVAQQVRSKLVFPSFGNQVLEGHKMALKSAVEVESAVLAQRLKGLKTRDEQCAAIIAETDPIRFFDDQSGYLFTYDLNGVRINVPVNKSQNNQNLLAIADPNGFHFIGAMVDQARAGGGYVQYVFEKPGQGVQPKLSYVRMIPGTDIFIGAGVYIDDVETEKAALAAKMDAQNHKFQFLTLSLFAVIMVVTVAFAFGLARAVSRTIEKIVAKMHAGSDEVASAAGQVSSASQILAEGSSEQAASIEETSSSLEEMSSMTRRNADNAHKANDLAKQARQVAEQGSGDMQTMSTAMKSIKDSSDDIAKIIKTIDEIAFQTNILALNAAVEAARAGEAGMGFAVVADEVRNLAQRSAQAAKETAAKIEGAISNTAQGVQISNQVALVLSEIVAKVRQVDDLVAEVSGASREQTQGIIQINAAVGQMDTVTQSNAASAEESAAAAQELNAQAIAMRQAVRELEQLVSGGATSIEENVPRRVSSVPSVKPKAHQQASRQPNLDLGATVKRAGSTGQTPGRNEIPLAGDFKDF